MAQFQSGNTLQAVQMMQPVKYASAPIKELSALICTMAGRWQLQTHPPTPYYI